VIVAVPPDTPVSIPELLPIVATAVLLLVQVPPVNASVSVEVVPGQTTNVPAIAPGSGFTVNGVVTIQVVPSE